jgi:hypothetical protein
LNRISKLNVVFAAFIFLMKKETRKTSIKFIGTIIAKFFVPQFQSRLRLKKRMVVNVDHELDKLIPFSADYIKIYMGFSHLWIRSVFFIYLEFGNRSLLYINKYINSVAQLYKNGYEVSNRCQSTTTRPGSGRNIPLRLIHWADPHLHCVPSLHVMIVCFNQLKIQSIISALAGGIEGYEEELAYLENQAIQITNSILYMKQHSINCIPAGLFALSAECQEFNDEYAFHLIAELKKLNIDSIGRFEEITSYIIDLYTDFQKLSKSNSNKKILIDFLLKYEELPKL